MYGGRASAFVSTLSGNHPCSLREALAHPWSPPWSKCFGAHRLPVAGSHSARMSWRNEEVEDVGLPLLDLSRVDIGDRSGVLNQVLETAKARDFVLAEEHGWLP